MDNPSDNIKQQPGFQEYRDLAARTPTAKFPWSTLLGNVVGIAGAHAAGYYAAGALSRVLANSRVGSSFGRLPAAAQRQLLALAIGAAGSVGAVSASLASLAGQMRVAEELSRLESERHAAEQQGNTKMASLCSTYHVALREMYR